MVLARLDMIDDPRFSTNSRRAANRPALDEEMGKALSRFDAAGLAGALKRAGVAFGRYNNVGDFAHHAQLRRAEIGAPTGPVSVPAPPQIFDRRPVSLGPSPAIGQHSDAIRREFADEGSAP
jgi:crotonobetainyl-CoA:carnitine CoA-transferase CaiB-like acyl-CoA transferase